MSSPMVMRSVFMRPVVSPGSLEHPVIGVVHLPRLRLRKIPGQQIDLALGQRLSRVQVRTIPNDLHAFVATRVAIGTSGSAAATGAGATTAAGAVSRTTNKATAAETTTAAGTPTNQTLKTDPSPCRS